MAKRQLTKILAMACLGLVTRTAWAIEPGAIRTSDKWSVVGVISGDGSGASKATGIAVLRNNQTKHTYTVAVGDSVPTEFGYVLKKVADRDVEISNGKATYTLAFAEASATSEENEEEGESAVPSRTERFLDAYYRSLDDAAFEYNGATDEGEEAPARAQTADAAGFVPYKRFGMLKGTPNSRYELYRAGHAYRDANAYSDDSSEDSADMADDGDNSDNVDDNNEDGSDAANYDNFDAETDRSAVTVPNDYAPPQTGTYRDGADTRYAADDVDQVAGESSP